MDGNNKKYCKMNVLSRLSGLSVDNHLKCYILAFMRHIKENHLIKDFKFIWKDKYKINVTCLKDIYVPDYNLIPQLNPRQPYWGFEMLKYKYILNKKGLYFHQKHKEYNCYVAIYGRINNE